MDILRDVVRKVLDVHYGPQSFNDEVTERILRAVGVVADEDVKPARITRHLAIRYRLEYGELVPHSEGQWTHVEFCGVKEWVLDEPWKLGEPHP